MRHRFWAIFLTLGAVFGFAAGFASLYRHGGFGHRGGHFHGPFVDRQEFEAHIAEVCVRAADKLRRPSAAASDAADAP